MKLYMTTEKIKEQAEETLKQLGKLDELIKLDLPGQFVFSPPSHRLVVTNLDELHQARKVLRETFGWRDKVDNKFFSCGKVIVTFVPVDTELPIHFAIWVESPPDSFPKILLGECILVKHDEVVYNIMCKV